ncbi:MAG: acyl carrier protein [Gammaproteobacteria bacterium]
MTQTEVTADAGTSTLDTVRTILIQTLQLDEADTELDEDTELLGNIPEMDSMAVVTILTALEEQFGFDIDDAEMSAETFETLGTLVEFVEQKNQGDA